MKAKLLLVFCALIAASAAVAATAGSCEKYPTVITPAAAEKTFNGNGSPFELTQEFVFDDDESGRGHYTNNYVRIFRMNLKRLKSYTVWLAEAEGAIQIETIMAAEPTGEQFPPSAMFEVVSGMWGSRYVLTADQWDYDPEFPEFSDPASWNYFIRVVGEKGATAVLHFQEALAVPVGLDVNPLVLSPKETIQVALNGKNPYPFVIGESDFWCSSPVVKGRRYLFASVGGNETCPYDISVGGAGKLTPLAPETKAQLADYGVGSHDAAYFYDADGDESSSGSFAGDDDAVLSFSFIRSSTNEESKIKVVHRVLPARTIAAHNPVSLDELGDETTIVPGRINDTGLAAYDDIIDYNLFSFKTVKGKNYVIETEGAKTNMLMRVYDAKGNVFLENSECGDGSGNARCAFTATAAATYYVGVAQKLVDDDRDELLGKAITLKLSKIDLAPDPGVSLSPVPVDSDEDEPWVEDLAGVKSNVLDRTHWSNTFAIAGRKGLTYKLDVTLENGLEAEDVFTRVEAEVFYLSGKTEKAVAFDGDIMSGLRALGTPLVFNATQSTTYYVRVRVAEGVGLDFPAYRVHCIGYNTAQPSTPLGILKGVTQGAEGTWSLDRESVKYPNGGAILVPAGTYTVKFNSVKNFSTPPAQGGVSVAAKATKTVTGVYNDTFDPKDDNISGATSWSIKTAFTEQSRTLWIGDQQDWFKISASDGYYYDFRFTSVSEGGDAVMSLYEADGVTPAKEGLVGVAEIVKCGLAKGTYYLKVSHRNEGDKKDGSYAIQGRYANVGAIKFAKAEYAVKDNAASVTLTVNRTAKDGMLKVAFKTVDGTAKGRMPGASPDDPAEKFYTIPESDWNVLVWGDGDNKAKTITVELLPDLMPTYHDFLRYFTVQLSDGGGEYPVVFSRDKSGKPLNVATVKLTETAKKAPGTVQVADDGIDVKKPVFDVTANDPLYFNLARVDGTNGAITVKIDTSALTGKKGDFKEVSWADGEYEDKFVEILVPPATDMKTSKKVTLKLSATSKDKPKFAASSITVNVYNNQFKMTMADYVKTLPKTAGYTVKEKKSGTWFVCNNGTMSGTGDLDFTLTGPCTFKYWINGELRETIVVTAAEKTRKVTISACDGLTYEYVFNGDGGETIYQAVQYSAKVFCANPAARPKLASGGKLPAGLKLEQDKATKEWFVRGVPTAAGYFYAGIEDSSVKPAAAMTNFAFNVVALGSAVGTFNGLAAMEAHPSANRLQSLAQVTLTTATSGKLSAKVAIGGKTYSFAATGFGSYVESHGKANSAIAELTQIQKVQSQVFTNRLTATVLDADLSDPDTWRTSVSLTLTMAALPDLKGNGYQADVRYSGRAYRDNSKDSAWTLEAAKFSGYYTTALVPMMPSLEEGEPAGNGYLTLTLDAKGKVKIAGMLANGTAYSASSVVGNLDVFNGDPVVNVPLYSFKNPTLFGGWLTIRFPDDGDPVVTWKTSDDIRWISEDAAAAYDGKGFDLKIVPVGGYYDTVVSLQRYYLDDSFNVVFPYADNLANLRTILKATYGSTYDFVAEANPNMDFVDLIGDTLSAEKQKLVKNGSTYVWEDCINAANVKLTLKRATGILNGTCDLWYEGQKSGKTTAGKLSGLKHNGVLIMNREAEGPLQHDVWSAGSVVIPQSIKENGKTRKWNASFPFNIVVWTHSDS